jgi:uncharacterized protein with PIN domain
MAAKVIDASALAAVLFDEPGAESIAARLANSHLYAPTLLQYELANVCFVKCKRHPEQHRVLLKALPIGWILISNTLRSI